MCLDDSIPCSMLSRAKCAFLSPHISRPRPPPSPPGPLRPAGPNSNIRADPRLRAPSALELRRSRLWGSAVSNRGYYQCSCFPTLVPRVSTSTMSRLRSSPRVLIAPSKARKSSDSRRRRASASAGQRSNHRKWLGLPCSSKNSMDLQPAAPQQHCARLSIVRRNSCLL